MPLSENEQKMLDQMERALYAEDPRFATHMKGRGPGSATKRRIALGACVALFGLGLVVAGVWASLIALGVIGFALMVAGVAWAATPVRSRATVQAVGPQGQSGATRTVGKTRKRKGAKGAGRQSGTGGASFVQRMDERWERRKRDQQGW